MKFCPQKAISVLFLNFVKMRQGLQDEAAARSPNQFGENGGGEKASPRYSPRRVSTF
jgi:hypothetical protein